MGYNRPGSRSHKDRPRCPDSTPRPGTALNRAEEAIVREAVDLVRAHNVAPFDAADWVTAHYGYVDIESVLQRVRDGVDRS
jgi:hypothetical protein